MRNRKSCRKTILRMIKERDITLLELKKLHQQKHVILLGGHVKQLNAMLRTEQDEKALITEDSQRCPSSYRGVINRTIDREGGSLEQLLKRKNLNRNVEIQIYKMICEQKKNVKDEQKTVPAPRKPWVIACRLDTDNLVHLVGVGLKTNKELLALSNRTLCGQIVTRDNVVNFSNKTTCPACLREDAKRNNQEK